MANQDSTNSGVGLPAGTKIGKYEVVERLAMGGQAVIYRCHDPFLDREVAIKQISTHLAEDEKFLERFRKEAQILARLGSEQPAIVTIHEMIEDEKGLFIVMEFVKGPTLEQVLQDTDGPTQTKAVLQLLWRLAAALYDVHAAGVVHRDLKPSNIIVAEGLHPKIADFGVAASSTGQESMVLGTTKYMAPELYGDGPVDGRADMYSLGFIMYELLIGRPKFEEVFADVIRDRHSEALRWMKWHGNKDLKAPAPQELNPSVPRELSHIVMKMIAKDPHERYENMEALGRAIKLGFSSKSKGAAAAGRQRRRGGVKTASASPAASGAGMELDDSGILPADEPTPELSARRQRRPDQEPELEEPATAPVPKSSLSRKTKLILAAVVVLGIVGIGIVVGVRRSQEEMTYRQRLEQAFSKAMDNYQETNYEAAAKGFQEVVHKFPDTTEANKASVLVHLARGYMAVEQGKKELA
ncbi:MAG: serine/threonine-protein kinase, partial [Phycisphaerae bacterium]